MMTTPLIVIFKSHWTGTDEYENKDWRGFSQVENPDSDRKTTKIQSQSKGLNGITRKYPHPLFRWFHSLSSIRLLKYLDTIDFVMGFERKNEIPIITGVR